MIDVNSMKGSGRKPTQSFRLRTVLRAMFSSGLLRQGGRRWLIILDDENSDYDIAISGRETPVILDWGDHWDEDSFHADSDPSDYSSSDDSHWSSEVRTHLKFRVKSPVEIEIEIILIYYQ